LRCGSSSRRSPVRAISRSGRSVSPRRTRPHATTSETPRAASTSTSTPPSFPSTSLTTGETGARLVRTGWPSRRTSLADSSSSSSCGTLTTGTTPRKKPWATRSSARSSWEGRRSPRRVTRVATEPSSSVSWPSGATTRRSNSSVPPRRPSWYARRDGPAGAGAVAELAPGSAGEVRPCASAIAHAATCWQGSTFPPQSQVHSPSSTYRVTVGATGASVTRTR
jgi:hypothetical protein